MPKYGNGALVYAKSRLAAKASITPAREQFRTPGFASGDFGMSPRPPRQLLNVSADLLASAI